MTSHAATDHSEPSPGPSDPVAVPPDALKMLAPDTRDALAEVAERISVAAGAMVFAEADRGNELFIVERGEVTGYQAGREDDAEWPVLHLAPGDILGEMSFLDGGPRQLTARAKTDCVLLKINPLDLLLLENGDHFYDNLRASVGITVVRRLRVGTEIHVAALAHQLEAAKTQQHFGQFFIYTIAMFSIGMIVNNIISSQWLEVDIYTQQFAWQYLAVLLIPSFIVVRLMRIPFSQLGLTDAGLRKSMTEGGIASLIAVALSAVLVVGSRTIPALPDLPVELGWSMVPSYLVHSFLQEIVARGLLQTSFQRFLQDKRGYRAVVLSAVMFGIFHIHFGLLAVGLTIVSSIGFGLFYLRHQNIFGVTLLHFMIGACAFSIGLL